MPKLIMMVGVAGSGKSTVAMRYALTQSAIIYSSDAIRAELYGDENCQKALVEFLTCRINASSRL